MRRLRWEPPERTADSSVPKRPYRDTMLVYGGMAVVIVVIATLTGGSFVNAVLIAGVFFVVATLWSWRNWRNRLRDERERAAKRP
jgi:membrane protein implicated in regulation of membrane protease activity